MWSSRPVFAGSPDASGIGSFSGRWSDQVHCRHAAAIQPIAREAERRTIADRQADDVGVEILGRLQVARQDRIVVE